MHMCVYMLVYLCAGMHVYGVLACGVCMLRARIALSLSVRMYQYVHCVNTLLGFSIYEGAHVTNWKGDFRGEKAFGILCSGVCIHSISHILSPSLPFSLSLSYFPHDVPPL